MVDFVEMDEKTLLTLEYAKVLDRLSAYAAFSASAKLARSLKPSSDYAHACTRLALTGEARFLISLNADVSVGGVSDIRELVDLARRGGVLTESELLQVSHTLMTARDLARSLEKHLKDLPHLAAIAASFPPPAGLIEAINFAISERGEVLDRASSRLSSIRSELKISFDRLMSRLERMLSDPHTSPMLQEAIITQRNGRYVIPLRSEFKGRVRSIVHDQSSSGATLFVEPVAVVELNNRWHELQLEERDEIRRILYELSAKAGQCADELNYMVEALAEFDLALMCAKYAEDLHACEPILHDPSKNQNGGKKQRIFYLSKARHPLLDPQIVVPIDVILDPSLFVVVITGPNTGGKTVTLKTVGLMVLMAQSGLHIPAQSGSEISFFKNVYADIGDEQSIEQSLSTFSGHITNITRILKHANPNTLILLDELGAGTDPQEGSAIARGILSFLVERSIPSFIATHYPEMKSLAHATGGVINASMEFDLKTLRPTYHLTIGIPGRSNAIAIAKRLGLPEEILESARTWIDPADLKADNLLDDLHRQRELAEKARRASEQARQDVEQLRADLKRRLAQIEDERQSEMERTRQQNQAAVEGVQNELTEVRRQLARARQPLEALKALEEQVSTLEEKLEKPAVRKARVESVRHPLQVGERIVLKSLQMEGVLTAISESDIEVRIGNLKVRAKPGDVQRRGEEEPQEEATAKKTTEVTPQKRTAPALTPGMEIDLRGMRAEDALDALDRYLDSAYGVGMPFVRIIHGKGTGRLRQVIREALHASPHVQRYESGQESEGGDGVTVAFIVVD